MQSATTAQKQDGTSRKLSSMLHVDESIDKFANFFYQLTLRRRKHRSKRAEEEKKLSTSRITISSFGSTSYCSIVVTIIWDNTSSTLRRSSPGYKPSCLRCFQSTNRSIKSLISSIRSQIFHLLANAHNP
ncbi:hypothetical protein CRE_16406 [Caenorhabditis remanei]|uniref:Uncharacterized protein n=1 Tax=Caenorhabditis remanei TaxID=31234 RepID=E3NC42_CAERE|nr:hypothetical protein CRE_16406 [Caenorhabditis remanei]